MTAASTSITAVAPLAVVSTAAHDGVWWAEEAAGAGADWSGVVAAALEMMIAAGIIEQPEPKTMTPWDGPSWREAAVEYHKDRRDRRLVIEIDAKRLARLRRLLADEISPDRAWHELRSNFQKGFS